MVNETAREEQSRPVIGPQVERFIEVLDVAEKVAQRKFGTSIDGLREQGEPTNDYQRIAEVVEEANGIVGPEDQFATDYQLWQETRQTGSHKMSFRDWRKSRDEACRAELERLQSLVDLRKQKERGGVYDEIARVEKEQMRKTEDTSRGSVALEGWGTFHKLPSGGWRGPGGNYGSTTELGKKLEAELVKQASQMESAKPPGSTRGS